MVRTMKGLLVVLAMLVMIVTVGAVTETFYPTIDGELIDTHANYTFAQFRGDSASTTVATTTYATCGLYTAATTAVDNFSIMRRCPLSYNTSTIPDDATINYVSWQVQSALIGTTTLGDPTYGITGGVLASSTALEVGDYDGFVDTPYSDSYYTAAQLGVAGTNSTYNFNTAGLSDVNKTGQTTIFFRQSWDYPDNAFGGSWVANKNSLAYIRLNASTFDGSKPHLFVTYNSPPSATITSNTTACYNGPCTIQFNDTSLYNPTSWSWSFDDGTYSTVQNATHTFTNIGLYHVTLTATNAFGSTTSSSRVIGVIDPNGYSDNFSTNTSSLFSGNKGIPAANASIFIWDTTNGVLNGTTSPLTYFGNQTYYTPSPFFNGTYKVNMTPKQWRTDANNDYYTEFIWGAQDIYDGQWYSTGTKYVLYAKKEHDTGKNELIFANVTDGVHVEASTLSDRGLALNTVYNWTIVWEPAGTLPYGNTINIYENDTLVFNVTDTTIQSPGYFGFSEHQGNLYTVWWDDLNVNPDGEPASITTYPVTAINETRILPNSDTSLPSSGLNVSINATPDQYEQSSFVIKPNSAINGINITPSALTDGLGHTIPASAIDVRTVKVWYQANDTTINIQTPPQYLLAPELLLKNDSIIRVDLTNQTNEVWIKNATFEGYYHIDNTTIGAFPTDALIYDNATSTGGIQPLSLSANENRQIMMTTHIPSGQTTGNYTGTITISSPFSATTVMNFSIRVLPFSRDPPSLINGIYYQGWNNGVTPTYNIESGTQYLGYDEASNYKSNARYSADLTDMKNHGVSYPTSDQLWFNSTTYAGDYYNNYGSMLDLRVASGLPVDRLYMSGGFIPSASVASSNPAILSALSSDALELKIQTAAKGFGNYYAYGIDEANSSQRVSEILSHQTVLSAGSYVWDSGGSGGAVYDLINYTSAFNVAYTLNSTERDLWHAKSKEMYSYANPQGGIENPEIYRTNYGLSLWTNGYDGSFIYSYQKAFGQNIWNDYDQVEYRDHVMAYPKTDGVIDTIQWEGYRQGVDDARLADTLSNITGNRTEATTIINANIAAGVDMNVISGNLIDAILDAMTDPPVANFTATPTSGAVPLTVQFNDTSIYSPTTWIWYIDTNTTPFSTSQNPTYTFTGNQTYTIRLNVSNANGFDWENKTAYISGLAVTPVAAFSANVTTGDAPLIVNFTDTSTNTPTTWAWYVGDTLISTGQHPTYTFTSVGAATFDIRLNTSNSAGYDWENKTGYISFYGTGAHSACISDSSTISVTSALNTLGLMLVIVGMVGILYSLLGAGGFTGGRSNYGGTGQVNMMLIVASIMAIMIGAVMLVMGYLIVSAAMGMSIACL